MNRKWSDFLFAIAIRFFCGVVLVAIASILICAPLGRHATRQSLLISVFGDKDHPNRPYYWIGAWSLVAGIIAALTVPKWKRPWFRRDPDDINNSVIIESIESIKTIGKDGEHHEYHSIDEVPPDIRMKIEELKAAATKETHITKTSRTENETKSTIIREQNIFEVTDAAGVKRVYQSLDEMPSEMRAAMLKADQNLE